MITTTILASLQTLTLAGSDPSTATFWMPIGASTFAGDVDWVMDFINWVCYFFFVLVVGLMVIFAVKYRVRKGQKFRVDGPVHHTGLELTWTIIPLILSMFFFWFGFTGYLDMQTVPKNSYDINVTASKWLWNFTYPNGAQSEDLYVPAGKPVRLVLRATDVLHSCFIPAFRVKKDCVPGRVTNIWFQSDCTTGFDAEKAFNLHCTEYCGTGHSNMNRKVYVLEQVDFDQWLIEQANWLDEIPDDQLFYMAGPKFYARCAQCHSLDGAAGIGPTWKGIWGRVTGGAGSDAKFVNGKSYTDLIGPGKVFDSPEAYIQDSIWNPGHQLVAPFTNAMPTFKGQLNERSIEAIIGMMKNLDDFDAKGKYLKGSAAPATK